MCTENLITRVEPRLVSEGWRGCRCVDRSEDGRPEEGGDADGVGGGSGMLRGGPIGTGLECFARHARRT